MTSTFVRLAAAMAGSVVVTGGLIGAKAVVGGAATATPTSETPPPTSPRATPPASSASSSAPSPGGAKDGTYTGAAVRTRYGNVQVEIKVGGGRLTDVRVVQAPSRDRECQQINAYALPILISEAVAAQSAHIDAVSGATYTSDGYVKSLQSAIDQAGL